MLRAASLRPAVSPFGIASRLNSQGELGALWTGAARAPLRKPSRRRARGPALRALPDTRPALPPPSPAPMPLALPLALLPASLAVSLALVAVALPLPAQAFTLQEAVAGLEAAVAAAGPAGPLLFVAAYVAATVLLVPASLLTVAAGFLFGPIAGTAVVSVAATLGAAAAFVVGRYVARPAVERRAAADARFAAVDRAIAAQGAKIVLLLRLSPLVPFSLLNYGLSLTSIPLGPYVAASWAGMLPGTVAYVALGGAGKAAAESAAGAGASPLQLALYVVGAAATLGATVLISRAASQALKEASQLEEPLQGGGGGGGDGGRDD